MAFDALFVTGGMSMGAYDYVPRTLVELGVDLKITKLRIKPGKPFVFGVKGSAELKVLSAELDEKRATSSSLSTQHSALSPRPSALSTQHSALGPQPPALGAQHSALSTSYVFGLPGNPLAAYVCTLRLASRLLTRLAGGAVEEHWLTGRLEAGLPANGPREFYQPVVCTIPPAPGAPRTSPPPSAR